MKQHQTIHNAFKWIRQSRDWFSEVVILGVMGVIALVLYGLSILIAKGLDIELHQPSITIVGGVFLMLVYWIVRSSLFGMRGEYYPISADGDVVMSHNDIVRSLYYQGNDAIIASLNNGNIERASEIARLLKEIPLRSNYVSNHHFYHELAAFVEQHPNHRWISQWQWYYQNRFGEAPLKTNTPNTKHVRAYAARTSNNQGQRS